MADTIPGSTATTEVLPDNGTVASAIDSMGDADWFRTSFFAGYGYQIWLEGQSGGKGTLIDPLLKLYDPLGVLITQDDDSGTGFDAFLYYAPPSLGTYFVGAFGADISFTGTYELRIVRDELDSTASQKRLNLDTQDTGSLGFMSDVADWRKVQLVAGTTYLFDLTGSDADGQGQDTLADPILFLHDATGLVIADDNDGGAGHNARILYTATSTGNFWLDAQESGNDAAGTYRIAANASPVDGTLTVNGNNAGGSIDFAGDVDLYQVQLTAGSTYTLSLNGVSLVDPYLELLNASGMTVADNDNGSGAGLNSRISYQATVSGTYYVMARASGHQATGTYTVGITAPPPGDFLEPNNSVATAYVIGNPGGSSQYAGLSITAGDSDYFRITLDHAGRHGDAVVLDFLHAQGDLDMDVYNANGSLLVGSSQSSGNQELVSLEGLAAGNYIVKVFGFNGATNPNYDFTFELAPAAPDGRDALEDDDTPATATVLGPVTGTVTRDDLAVEAGDPDWFRFTLAQAGRAGDVVTVAFEHAHGDIDIALYAADGTTLVAQSTGTENQESISLAGRAAGDYYVRVYGYNGAANPDYSISVTAGSGTLVADRFENNDQPTSATALGIVQGTRVEEHLSAELNDADWYTFTLAAAGRPGDHVSIDFEQALGNLDMALFNVATQQVVGISATSGNHEEISLNGLAAGAYAVVIGGLNGFTNPDYKLTVAVAPNTIAADRFEQNDSAATAFDFGNASGQRIEAGLTMEANDEDWYRFTLVQTAKDGDNFAVAFSNVQGDIDVELRDASGAQVLRRSTGSGDMETISLAGLQAGTYLARVYGYHGAGNPDYALNLAAARPIVADGFEQNDTAATASDLRTVSGTVVKRNLSAESNDADWYRFTMARAGQSGDKVRVDFLHAQGDVDLELYRADGTTLVYRSSGAGDGEEISLNGLAAGDYLVKVFGYNGAANPRYDLTITASPAIVPPDRFENNDSSGAASNLGTLSGALLLDHLSVEGGDDDWFRFTTTNAGLAGQGIAMAFDGALGDIDMELYSAATGARLATSTGSSDTEAISFDGLAAGSYLLRVYGAGGGSNPDYSLILNAPAATALPDRYDHAAGVDVKSIAGTFHNKDLSITAGDVDLFQFTLDDAGRAGDFARIDFNAAAGDIDLFLYAADGTTLLASSQSTDNFEQISLQGRIGTYQLIIKGYNGATNPNYEVTITGPKALAPDAYEANDSRATATQLREKETTIHATLDSGTDTDFYEFVLETKGAASDLVRVRADRPFVSVQLLDANGTVRGSAFTDAGGVATISLANRDAGHWFVEVDRTADAPRAAYDLDLKAAGVAQKAGWTVMLFMDGDNNLEEDGVNELLEMESAARAAGINVVVALDRRPDYFNGSGDWTDTRLGFLGRQNFFGGVGSALGFVNLSSDLASQGEWNMGSGDQLTAFINTAAQMSPADHYALVFWDHGSGTLGGQSFDDSSGGDSLGLQEMREAIERSNVQRFDLVVMQDCLMATVETAAELDGVADFFVSSELISYTDAYDDRAILESMRTSTSGRTLATKWVDSPGNSGYAGVLTRSAVDLHGIAALQTAIDNFVAVTNVATGAEWQQIVIARGRSKAADGDFGYMVDLGSFMQKVIQQSSNASIDNAAQGVLDALSGAVIRNSGPAGYTGLTIYMPNRGDTFDVGTYALTDFGVHTQWSTFAQKFLAVALPAAASFDAGVPDFAESFGLDGRPVAYANDTADTPYRLGTINSSTFAINGLSIDYDADVDWYSFTMPTGAGPAPYLAVQSLGGTTGLRAQLVGPQTTVQTSTADTQTLTFGSLQAGVTYLLRIDAVDAHQLPQYELNFNAFGPGGSPVALPDFAEAAGGNNSANKAWTVGTPWQVTQVGGIANLSLDAADLASGANGGDWFRVPARSVTESNVNLVRLSDVTNGAAGLVVRVYDLQGQLIAQSDAPGDVAVTFAAPVDDVLVQVQSATGAEPVRGYTLHVESDHAAPVVHRVLVAPIPGHQPGVYGAGVTLHFLVAFDEAVAVTGTPTLNAVIGNQTVHVAYTGGSGTPELDFQYVVQPGDLDANGISFPANALHLNGGAISDLAGNTAQLSSVAVGDNFSFRIDTAAPTFVTLSPSDAATSVPVGANLVATFNEPIASVGSGNIVLKVLGGAVVETFDALSSPRLTFGSNSVTIDPTANLVGGTTYEVVFESGSVRDVAGNPIAATGTWDFTTFLAGQAFNGGSGVDNLTGTPGNDTFHTQGGNDTINGGKGDDLVDGGDGRDFAVFSGFRSSYSVVRSSGSTAIVSGTDGTDSLQDVERLKFDDAYVALDITGNGGIAYRLYQAAFDRAPDMGGLGFQINALDIGFGITDLAANFIESGEFTSRYGNLTNAQFVTQLYRNVLHRDPDPDGFGFHTHNLDLGLPRYYLLAQFSESAENQANVIGAIANGMTYLL